MRSLFDENAPEPEEPKEDADLTLGIGSLLSIFFGVVLICGIFFGFGYSMGRRNAHANAIAAQSSTTAKPQEDGAAGQSDEAQGSATLPTIFKEPGQDDSKSPAVAAEPPPAPRASTPTQRTDADEASATTKPAKSLKAAEPDTTDATLTAVPFAHRAPLPTKPHAGVMSPAIVPVADAPVIPGHSVMVQIAAVSREEDAEVLAGALRKRGFSPQVHGGTADKFFHVQVGPFADKSTAETMKQHLLADGYNAIVK